MERMAENDDEKDPIRSALSDLLQSEGWRFYKQAAEHEWGPSGYGRRMQEALTSIPVGPDRAYELARVAEQVDATANAVNALIAWPSEELRRRTPAPVSRRPFANLRRSS